jgi:hypothetical protein
MASYLKNDIDLYYKNDVMFNWNKLSTTPKFP